MSRTLSRRRRQHRGRPRNRILGALAVLVVLGLGAGVAGAAYALSIASSAPPLSSLPAVNQGEVSTVYAANGQRLGVIQAENLRLPAPAATIPKSLRDATVAIEDERFYHHHGVDYEGVARAVVANVAAGSAREGASTITQQVIKNLYSTREKTYERKLKEAKLATELEKKHTKAWILNTYLNTVPYGTAGGQSAYGVRAAARVYFDKPVQRLTLAESALLAGLPQAPSQYSPFKNPAGAQKRRDEVLRKMAELKLITPAQSQAAIAKPVDTKSVTGSKYFTQRREKYFFDYVKDELLKEYGAKTVRQGGLKVTTTIDLDKQKSARAAIAKNLAGVGPSSAIVTIDPRNGYIKAMASSAAYGQSKFNLAAQGKRQPGSVFKVMTLMTALRRGVNPDTTTYVSRSPTIVKSPLCPGYEVNTYSRTGAGSLNLTRATLKSDNSVYIQLAIDLGPAAVKQTARDLGIRSKLGGYCAETLGGLTDGVSPLEMANAYATIASGGYRNRPTAITKVTFPSGRVEKGSKLPKRFRIKRTRAFSPAVTYQATQILEQNVKSGTGTRAEFGCPAAGKTGTTDKNTDAWFVGYTQRLATATWVGYPNDRTQMTGLFNGANVDGGTFPAIIWGQYMKQAAGKFCGEFTKPAGAFVSRPFKQSDNSVSGSSGDTPSTGETTPTVPQTPDTSPAPAAKPDRDKKPRGGGKTGGTGPKRGGNTTGDPGDYQSPPSGGGGDSTGVDGGAAAPG